jgi:nicotinamide-nucleotide amidase
MIAEIISTGTELLLGQIVNTNAQYISARLASLGIHLFFQTTVGDNRLRMEEAIVQALHRADIVITTGGLGPTLGDITKEVSAIVFGRKLELHKESLARICDFFSQRGLVMTENNVRQAMMPAGAIVLENKRGTAPGVILEKGQKVIIHLPGPPHEMKGMFEDAVVPYLVNRYNVQTIIHSRVLRCVGIGESMLEEKIKDLLLRQSNPTLALLARHGEIHIRITVHSSDIDTADAMLDEAEKSIRDRLGIYVFGVDEETLAEVVGRLLVKENGTLACAESCTGGLLSSLLTDVPGSSQYFTHCIISYSNEAKMHYLGVREETLAQYGAVSEQTAGEMAAGIRRTAGTDYGIAVTGIAGPSGATEEKPVGLVYIGLAASAGITVKEFHFSGDRFLVKQRAALSALNILRCYLLNIGTK